jgi:arabinan endo-1,5-alpha-L-arabinosidase
MMFLTFIKMKQKKLIFLILWCISSFSFAQESLEKNIIVHDPVMIKQDSLYYLFCTGKGIAKWVSKDMKHWQREEAVFPNELAWAKEAVKGFKDHHIWAPDISYHNDTYYLYYSISAFGKNTSCIGLATNTTLHSKSPDYKWIDHGKVIESIPGRDMWNAIDPNLITDENNEPWLAFGSFWNGIKLVKLNEQRNAIATPQSWVTVASRKRSFELADTLAGDAAIEAPFIFKKDAYYYLFVSFDYCCRGEQSTYKVVVGRSKTLVGPYLDKNGLALSQGGGTLVVEGNKDWAGVGHNAVFSEKGKDYLVFHGYDAKDRGIPKLFIKKIDWDKEGWLQVD